MKGNVTGKMDDHMSRKLLRSKTGVPLCKITYSRVSMYFDSRLDLEADTDIAEARKRIDARRELARAKRFRGIT